jgi:hypothetical protein
LSSFFKNIFKKLCDEFFFKLYDKLIGDVVYPMHPWFYSPFKGEKDGLPQYKAHWNFIQSNTRMSMEKTFGMFKGRFKILLKKKIPLHYMLNLVMTCMCLYNMCFGNSNGFDMVWILEVQKKVQVETNFTFDNIKRANMF